MLGLISKTRQGCDTLKQQGWDAVRHNRSMLWPIVPEELEPQLKPYNLSSVPGESSVSSHNSESVSVQPGKTKLPSKVKE